MRNSNFGGGGQPTVMPLTKVVKNLIIANVAVWLVLQVIVEGYIFPSLDLSVYFGLVPQNIFLNFFVWEFGTYMFLHDVGNPMHLVFNMFTLWMIGGELEQKWGAKGFLKYYLASGIGAAVIYFVGVVGYYLFTGHVTPMQIPVVGASGAIFGLLLAYGILFAERQMLFMFIFPVKAKWFVTILGVIELSMLMSRGIAGGQVANLAHLGGIVAGFLYLTIWANRQKRNKDGGDGGGKKKSNLKLIVNNDKPKYWN